MISPLVGIIPSLVAKDVLSVSWNTSSICNYRCSYCDSSFHDGKNKFPKPEAVSHFLRDLSQKTGKKIFIEMKGGEPTLWRDLDTFMIDCEAQGWGVDLVTNGSMKLEWWKPRIARFSRLTVSMHFESYDMPEMTEKLAYLDSHRETAVRFVMIPSHFEKVQSDIEELTDALPDLYVQCVIASIPGSGNKTFTYTDNQNLFMNHINSRPRKTKKRLLPPFPFSDNDYAHTLNSANQIELLNSEKIKVQGWNDWRGWLCTVGLDRIHIEANGDIFRGQCQQGGLIGNLHAHDWIIPRSEVTCEKERCFCGNEMTLRKWRQETISLPPKLNLSPL